MTWWEAILLGVVQGLTEFFPVSSSGHLVLGQAVLGLEIPGILFDVVVHVATIVSVVFVYRQKLLQLALGIVGRGRESGWPYLLKLVLATIPAGIVGLTLKDWFEARFDDPIFAATMILVTGSIAWSTRWALGTRRFGPLELLPITIAAGVSLYTSTLVPFLAVLALEAGLMSVARLTAPTKAVRREEPGWTDALLMGVAQAVAIFPGITRSGSTVITGL